jgi:hypothetical protein
MPHEGNHGGLQRVFPKKIILWRHSSITERMKTLDVGTQVRRRGGEPFERPRFKSGRWRNESTS